MLYDGEGHPIDFIYLYVNVAFERLTGLRAVTGKKVTPDFDSKCGFSQKNINNINESVREFSKV